VVLWVWVGGRNAQQKRRAPTNQKLKGTQVPLVRGKRALVTQAASVETLKRNVEKQRTPRIRGEERYNIAVLGRPSSWPGTEGKKN